MSVQIRLDIPALRSIIEQDPGFHLDLKSAVVTEIVRKSVLSQAGADLREEIASAAGKASMSAVRELREKGCLDRLATEAVDRIKHDIARQVRQPHAHADLERLRPVASALVTEALKGALAEQVSGLDRMAEEMISRAVSGMEQRLSRRIDAMEQAWREEAARQIKADVLQTLKSAIN